ncbi:MAG: hypothetical protein RRA35_09160, partial [Desulfomonilia bacterium]|nr:hypothetical protein [Desulfomonilia bacterium]
ISDIISLVFLINRRSTPFFKWMHRALKDLPILGKTVSDLVEQLVVETEPGRTIECVEDISALIISELRREGLSNGESDFLLDHGPHVQSRISDPELRKKNVWIG